MSETKRTLNDKNEAIETACHGEELLKQMKERGERRKSGGDYISKASFHDESMLPTLLDLGFTEAKAHRWQLIARLPKKEKEVIRNER